jgi:NTP pyrophosphatase (non-canonical NTP hydrolase)
MSKKKKFVKKPTKKKSTIKKSRKLTLDRYEKFVTGLASERSMESAHARLATAGLGLAGEAGEFADVVKKILFHDLEYTDDVKQRLLLELSDVMWYVTFTACNVLGVGIQEVIDANFEKLSARYQTGKFSHEDFMRKEQAK